MTPEELKQLVGLTHRPWTVKGEVALLADVDSDMMKFEAIVIRDAKEDEVVLIPTDMISNPEAVAALLVELVNKA